jgi:hypothetical protein
MLRRSLALASFVLLLAASTAGAATVSPNRFDDTTYPVGYSCPSDCSLRGAVSAAGQGDTIALQAGAYNLASPIHLSESVHVVGAGARSTSITSVGTAGLVNVTPTGIGTFSDLSITSGEGASAGALYNEGIATLTNVSVTGSAGTGGLGDVIGGAINNEGTLTIIRSTIAHNYAHAQGTDAASGGAIYNTGSLTVVNSTFSDNWVQTTTDYALGGAVYGTNTSQNSFFNVTFGTGNDAYSTSDANSLGGQAYTESGATWRISNTIFVDSIGSTNSDTCQVYFDGWISMGGNVDPTGSGACGAATPTDKKSVDAVLGPLANHGGQTDTQLISATGPAAGFGNATMCAETSPAVGGTDQRGGKRITGATCDSGAVELNSLAHLALSGGFGKAMFGSPVPYTLTLTNSGPDPVLGATVAGSLCTIGSLAAGASTTCTGSIAWNGDSAISQTFSAAGDFNDPVGGGSLTLTAPAPRLTSVSLRPAKVTPSKRGATLGAKKIKGAAKLKYSGVDLASLGVVIQLSTKGGKWKTVSASTLKNTKPAGTLYFTARVKNKPLKKGKYRLGLTGLASNGNVGSPWYVSFGVK